VAEVGGRPLADIQRDITAVVEQIQFPLEYHAEIPTKYSEQLAGDALVLWIGAAALVAILLLLQTAVRSWKLALAVFLSLPAALAGGAVAAWIAGGTITVLALTAFAVLLAIAGRNAALLSARTDELWREAPTESLDKMVLLAARDRVSPILKAALITAAILIPLGLFGGAVGGALLGPMALIIVCGLITTTLIGIFVLPLLTLWFGPRSAPEEWAEVYEAEVPVQPATQEKVEAK
jgi:Cu/Ag efflux pump CusA